MFSFVSGKHFAKPYLYLKVLNHNLVFFRNYTQLSMLADLAFLCFGLSFISYAYFDIYLFF